MKVILCAVCFIILSISTVFAQEKENVSGQFQAEMQKSEMRKLDKMVGKWKGEGWIQQGKTREEFVGTENVQKKIDGLALLVEGKFTDKKDSGKIIHETLAVLSYNTKTKIYDFKTYLANGSDGNFTMSVTNDGYEWGMSFPSGKILYIITIKDGFWKEVGKISRDDGKNWTQFLEMNLKKV